ncbi:hypothetical protein MKW98_012401 [Papaver atlanticum]|uniref:Uncharacterized protein n=1 Tax=Papaver atlanticum TaxID=357466 RepID=A0AAD4T1W3_9MAGN|nr:hypothetical protein MKW98_012401 [Papaver atlanticum]
MLHMCWLQLLLKLWYLIMYIDVFNGKHCRGPVFVIADVSLLIRWHCNCLQLKLWYLIMYIDTIMLQA